MAKIAACLIVRNSAETIERTLTVIRPFVDEINVFDTGSTDDTVAILRKMGTRKTGDYPVQQNDGTVATQRIPVAPIRVQRAKKSELPLSSDGLLGDFSWAREQSFAMCSDDVEWVFWLDDDDIIVGAENLRVLAMTAHQSLDGYVMFYDYAQDPNTGANLCALWRERLLRRKPAAEWGWRNAVHEVWLPHEGTNIVPNYLIVPAQQIRFVHARPEGRYPSTRNLSILERVVADAADAGGEPDPRTKAYMGTELMTQGRVAEAIPWFNAYIEDGRTRAGDDERMQVFHKLATCLRMLGNPLAAVEVEFSAHRERDDWAENAAGLAEAFCDLQQWNRCETWAQRAIDLGIPQSMLILNPLEFTLVPFIRIAQAKAAQKKYDEAVPFIAKAAAIQPTNPLVLETAAMIEREGFREKVVQAVLLLRETSVRFDENWKAYELLDRAVPYIAQDDPRIVSAKAMQRENVMHALKPDEYRRWYEDEPKESTVADEWVPHAGDHIERARFLLELAVEFEAEHGRKPRMLDLGCNDAWMAGYLWTNGEFVCDGVELNKGSVEKAKGRVERFGFPGRIVQGNIFDAEQLLAGEVKGLKTADSRYLAEHPRYDIVSCFEVYEHVPSTDRLLEVMESLLTPEGVACVTTPNGAFEDGNLQMWHMVERKGHLRAVTAVQLAEQLAGRGHIRNVKVHQGGRLTYAEWQPKRKRGKVVLYAPGAYEQWSPASINTTGIGGSETALSYLALGLADRGFDVRVFADAVPGVIGDTIWRPSSAFDATEDADAVIVSRNLAPFNLPEIHAPVRALWCHDATYADQITPRNAEKITDMVVLSEWSRDCFREQYPFIDESKFRIIRNGVALESMSGEEKFPDAGNGFNDRAPVCIYSSSADRGLDKLVEWWPLIRQQVPNAELHVYYGWETFDVMSKFRPELTEFKHRVMTLAAQAGGEQGGIFFKGRVGQKELYAAMQSARVWSYPTYFTETSCIGAMEARAAGLPVVTSKLAALRETVGVHGLTVDVGDDAFAPVLGDDYRDAFVYLVSDLLANEERWTDWHESGLDGIAECTWQKRLDDWIEMILPGADAEAS